MLFLVMWVAVWVVYGATWFGNNYVGPGVHHSCPFPFLLGLFAHYGVFGNCCCVAVFLLLEGILVLWARNPA